MSDAKAVLIWMIVFLILDFYYKTLPIKFGPLPGVIFLVFMIYLMIVKSVSLIQGIIGLVIGEVILTNIWISSLEDKKRKKEKKRKL